MEDIINKHDALILVRNTCRDVMLECVHHYDDEMCDDVYDDMSAVEAVLKCNKRIGKALNELPPVISGGDEDTISRQSAIDIVTPYDTNRIMRNALEDLPAQSENGTAKWKLCFEDVSYYGGDEWICLEFKHYIDVLRYGFFKDKIERDNDYLEKMQNEKKFLASVQNDIDTYRRENLAELERIINDTQSNAENLLQKAEVNSGGDDY